MTLINCAFDREVTWGVVLDPSDFLQIHILIFLLMTTGQLNFNEKNHEIMKITSSGPPVRGWKQALRERRCQLGASVGYRFSVSPRGGDNWLRKKAH